jgi:acetyl-CoA C-acetyltransferase
VTVTGGLPFAGGAGSDYMMHSIATMTDVLREDAGAIGLVSGVGMHMTKHVYAVYSATPGPVSAPDATGVQARLDEKPLPVIRDTFEGQATIAAYSVVHGRDGAADWALAVCDIDNGDRCYGRVVEPDVVVAMEAEEWSGRELTLHPVDNVNVATV